MANFPLLKTGAVAQYPLEQTIRFRTDSVQFLDGSRQRYRVSGSGLRNWQVTLDLLDDLEMAAVTAFVAAQGSAVFAFTDPVSGVSVPKCVLSGDQYEWLVEAEMRAKVKLTIREIP